MNIVVFESKPRDKKFFSSKLKKDKITYVKEPLTEQNARQFKDAEIIITFIVSKITEKVMKNMPKLKLIATRSTGFDHIDLKESKRRKIVVCNIPSYGSNTVAEHTFALILNLSRKVHKSYVRAQQENYEIEDLTGFDLKDKTLGIIGVGKIGQHVIKIAKGFGMHVIAYDNYKDSFLADLLHFRYVEDIKEIMKHADIISLHLPSLPSTQHIIDKKMLRLVKKGALLINTARGDLVDTDALYDALKSGKLGGAGLDVIEGEQLVKEDRAYLHIKDTEKIKKLMENKQILHMDNVVFTPHNAFNSKEALHRILETTLENIYSFKEGKAKNIVNG